MICPADVKGRARLADFGISRRLLKGQTTYCTGSAGTRCWKARETLTDEADIRYKSNTDVQVSFTATQTALMNNCKNTHIIAQMICSCFRWQECWFITSSLEDTILSATNPLNVSTTFMKGRKPWTLLKMWWQRTSSSWWSIRNQSADLQWKNAWVIPSSGNLRGSISFIVTFYFCV